MIKCFQRDRELFRVYIFAPELKDMTIHVNGVPKKNRSGGKASPFATAEVSSIISTTTAITSIISWSAAPRPPRLFRSLSYMPIGGAPSSCGGGEEAGDGTVDIDDIDQEKRYTVHLEPIG